MSGDKPSELDNLIALDIETSGLDEQHAQVLELHARFGRIVNGAWQDLDIQDFQLVGSRFSFVLPLITTIESWHPEVLKMHCANGLLPESMAEAKKALASTQTRFPNGCGPLALAFEEADAILEKRALVRHPEARWTLLGNSVHFDLRFVRRVFPKLAKQLSYRVFDMSSVRLFCETLGRPHVKGEPAHRASADVDQSLALYDACRDWCLPAAKTAESS